jgi:hypothetical protein
MSNKLEEFKQSRNLVSIRRDNIDDLAIQGFILAYSPDLILIQYVFDFNLDGLMVLRRCDVSKIYTNEIDIFQTQLLKDEGLFSKVNFQKEYDVKDWPTVFNRVGREYDFVIIEDEVSEEPEFLLGEIEDIREDSVSVWGFDGVADWDSEPTEMRYEYISSFKVGDNYSRIYKRFFERNALSKRSSRDAASGTS